MMISVKKHLTVDAIGTNNGRGRDGRRVALCGGAKSRVVDPALIIVLGTVPFVYHANLVLRFWLFQFNFLFFGVCML